MKWQWTAATNIHYTSPTVDSSAAENIPQQMQF